MEKILFKLFKKLYVKHLDKQVEKYWNIYHFNMDPNHTSHNNEGDAFKHTFMAAELTLLLGENLARKICILQEDSNPDNPPAEREMDLHNDEVGIQIGKEVDEETFSIFINRRVDISTYLSTNTSRCCWLQVRMALRG